VRFGSEKLLAKAARALDAAGAALRAGHAGMAAERALHAMLAAAQARLNERGQRLHSHARIAAAYAALPALPAAPGLWLSEALTLRGQLLAESDGLPYDDVAHLLERATGWVDAVTADVARAS
jgi:hypothetical protein